MGGNIKEIQDKEEFDAVTKNSGSKLVVVDFHAVWCGPCKMMSPKLEVFQTNYPDITIVKVNVDELQDVAEECGVSAMPTFHFYKDGKKVAEVIGASVAKVEENIKKYK